MCSDASKSPDSACERRSCRKSTTGAARRRWIGTRPWPRSGASASRCITSRCARWRVAEHFTWRTITPRSRLFWKHTSEHLAISVVCSGACATKPEERGEEDPARSSAGGDGAADRVPLALGIPDGVLQSSAGQRERRSGGRSRVLPPESSGADPTGEEPGRAERTVTKLLPARRTAVHCGQSDASRRSDADRTRASPPDGCGSIRTVGTQFSDRGRQGLRQSADELLLDAIEAGDACASENAAGLCRDLAGTGERCAARAQFRPL